MESEKSQPPTSFKFQAAKTYIILILIPLFFSSNVIIWRSVIDQTEPFTLAFFRWLITSLILLLFCAPYMGTLIAVAKNSWKLVFFVGFLGMWICGALVYFALKYTTAANGTLIYASSPVLIILLEWIFHGRKTTWRELLGIVLCITGVLTILLKGEFASLFALRFNPGDILFVVAALSWAAYSVCSKDEAFHQLTPISFIALIAFAGAITLIPFAGFEMIYQEAFPKTINVWSAIMALVILSSILPFIAYQYGIKSVGPSITGIFLYLLPVYGLGLAKVLLGETIQAFHLIGLVTILGGVIWATAPNIISQNH